MITESIAEDEVLEKARAEETLPEESAEADAPESRKSMGEERKADLRNRRILAAQKELELDMQDNLISIWSQLNDAKNKKTLLRGTISGTEMVDIRNTASKTSNYVFAVIIYQDVYKILIPFDQIYRDNPMKEDMDKIQTKEDEKTILYRQKGMIDNLYGLETPFIITNMVGNYKDYAIAGSRKLANQIIEQANYEKLAGTDRAYEVGSVHTATVTAVSDYGVAVNVGGVDTRIQSWLVSYRYIRGSADMKQLYHVNEKIKVVLTSVEKKENGYVVNVSGKDAELLEAPARIRLLGLKPGAQTFGTITQIRPHKEDPNRLIINLYLDSYKLPAVARQFEFSKLGFTPHRGDRVRVIISAFAENGMTIVKCRQYDGSIPSSFVIKK